MKQNFILWLGTLIIVFLSGYMSNVTGPYYPISGSIGLDGQPATFKFDKIYWGNDSCLVIVYTDVKNIDAFLLWRDVYDNSNNSALIPEIKYNSVSWQRIAMNNKDNILTAKLPASNPGHKINYRVELNYKGNQYYLPVDKPVTIEFWGKVNPGILQIYYFLLFGGLILAVRTGLEVFKDKPKIGVYTIFTVIFFFLYSVWLVPLVKSYELNAINHSVPTVLKLLTYQSVSLFLLWVIGLIAVFNLRGNKYIPPVLSAITLVIYIVIHT